MTTLLLLALACNSKTPADTQTTDSHVTQDTDTTGGEQLPVYNGSTGPFSVQTETDTVGGTDVTWYIPAQSNGRAIAWSHGFARSPENQAKFAERAATWGFLVATPKLPSFSDHEANALFLATDLRQAALARGATSVGYVGHSAGGLASLLAAGQSEAWVMVGLDGTDVSDLGIDNDTSVTAPTLLMVGEPSTCNSDGNGREWQTSGNSRHLYLHDATHCDFESDTDSLCTSFCGANDAARQERVAVWAIAYLLETAGADVGDWKSGGTEENAEITDGNISNSW